MDKASVVIGIIAKNSEKTIGDCLRSIVPYVKKVVVCVDSLTTDSTARIAKRNGAQVFRGFKVAEEHECPAHGKILVQHFARARNECFKLLPRDVDWHMWIDADDTVRGGEKLGEYLKGLPPEIDAVWLPYHYAKAVNASGPTSTLFDRERLIRTSRPWEWVHRVHEILSPVGSKAEHLTWARTDNISIHHQGEGHDTAGSARRNITLLEIDLEENPEDHRAWFYLGNQYFALEDWGTAIECYEKATGSDNPYQLWQTLIYLAIGYEKIGDLRQARHAAFRALEVQPSHPEPYYRLASSYMYEGDAARCEFWTKWGDNMPEPPPFVFRNPLDKPFNARLALAQAYANDGQISKARRQLEIAAQAIPSKEVLEGIVTHKQLEKESLEADAWVKVLETVGPGKINIPDHIWKFGRVRDLIVPTMISSKISTQPRIMFICGRSIEPWYPGSINSTGIGGSETAVIEIAKRFARDGWKVDVYNEPDLYEGVHGGVGYWGHSRITQGEQTDILVSWRNPESYDYPINRRAAVLWCHDLNKGPNAGASMARWEKVLGVSAWHADYMSKLYGLKGVGYVPNGIDLGRFEGKVEKIPFRCVYGSSQDRGLLTLLQLWPLIVATEPKAELHIAYGWESFDKTMAVWPNKEMYDLKQTILKLLDTAEGIVWRGRLPQDELARLYQESSVWLYPTQFLEVSCITAMEAMAGGCVPIVSAAGALPETVGDAGVIVTGNTYSLEWKKFWIHCAKAVMVEPKMRIPLAAKGLERARGFTWDRSYEEFWKPTVEELLKGECLGV